MIFNSFHFLIFFPIVVLCFYLIPARLKIVWLLVCSYYFYMNWNAKYALLLAAITLITYLCSILMERYQEKPILKKIWFFSGIGLTLLTLFYFKYFEFALDILVRGLAKFNVSLALPKWDILLPVGISFYTFQALSYIIDVYRGNTKAEKNPLRYAAFISFFPLLLSGPIERSNHLLAQLQAMSQKNTDGSYPKFPFNYEKAREGLLYMMLGYLEKMVLAERACVLVDHVYNSYRDFDGISLLVATLCFTLQIYCDFAGYSHIALGAAKVLGFDLINNFQQPYLATSIKDFWRRWHISLSGWFRDYVYIPLGGNRNGTLTKYRNLLITFLVSGLWHGASLHYIAWGGIHGLYQIIGDLFSGARTGLKDLLHLSRHPRINHFLQKCSTFILVSIAWIFFRATGVKDSFYILFHMLTDWDVTFFTENRIFSLGLTQTNLMILLIGTILLFLLDAIHEKGISISKALLTLPLVLRFCVYFILTGILLLQALSAFGAPASTFIYFQF